MIYRIVFFSFLPWILSAHITLGIDRLYTEPYVALLKGKNIGVVTNQTGISSGGISSMAILKEKQEKYDYSIAAFFAPEHGLKGIHYAAEKIQDEHDADGIPIYSLYGPTRRPTREMLQGITLLIYDIQDLGTRSYTYLSTLLYVMEAAAQYKIPVCVLDRPNPLGGVLIDGPMLEEKWRSFIGYLNVPYCHGLTIGELARYFNGEYRVGCDLSVVPMEGWNRKMTFAETGLPWIPPSPNIPEAQTAFYYPTTGLLGELQVVSIGVGYTLPFKVIGAPWIDADQLAADLNAQKLAGVYFFPFHYKPFFGRFAGQVCHGVYISIVDPHSYLPVTTQYLLIATLKKRYGAYFDKGIENMANRHDMFCKACGTDQILKIIQGGKETLFWPMRLIHHQEKEHYRFTRRPYLIPEYSSANH